MEIQIASGLARILDEPIERWGSIREALSACKENIAAEVIDIFQDAEFDVLFGRALKYSQVSTVDLSPDLVVEANKIAESTGLSIDQSATLMIDLVRTWIRTSDSLGYDY